MIGIMQSPSYVVNKVFKCITDHKIIDNVFNANVIIELCHERDNYYQYPLHLYSHAELRSLKKSLCTLSLPLHNCFYLVVQIM